MLVVVDKFSKMAHFIATTTGVTSEKAARLLLNQCIQAAWPPHLQSSLTGTLASQPACGKEVFKALGVQARYGLVVPSSDGWSDGDG